MFELPVTLTLIKMGTGVLMVVVLSVLAEAVSPRLAGIVSGYPLGAAVSLFFMGFEIGPAFAAQSALSTMLGLVATLVFAYGYYQCSVLAGRLGKGGTILLASMTGICGYFLTAWGLHQLPSGLMVSLLLPMGAILLFHHLFRNIDEVEILERPSVSAGLLAGRALFAALFIVLVTATARVVGPGWAGLFAAFPMTVLPLLLVIHYSYDTAHVHAILKSFPKGLGSLVVYTLSVFSFYPVQGVYLGTLSAYAFATLYLIVVQVAWSGSGRESAPRP